MTLRPVGRIARWRGFAALSVLLALALHAPRAVAGDCPKLDGHYRVSGFGEVLGDALKALHLELAGFRDSEVKITGTGEGELRLWVKSGGSGAMATRPSRVLVEGVDYDCAAGALVLRGAVVSQRKTDTAFLEGRSRVRLAVSRGDLGITAEFEGGEYSTLYRYDSARIRIPKSGTTQTLVASIRWPPFDAPRPEVPATPVESAPVQALRQRLQGLLGAVRLGWLSDSGARVLASLSASRREDVAEFEDRLHAAGLSYAATRAPQWSNNQYVMEFAFDAAPAAGAWHPSAFRVQQELERLQHPMVSVREVDEASGGGYVAALDVIGDASTDSILERLRHTSAMFRDVAVLSDAPQAGRRNLRVVKLWLRVE